MNATDDLASLLERLQAAARDIDLTWAPPATSGWVLSHDTLRVIMAAVKVLTPRHVIELGAGTSTRALMHAAAGQKPACAISSVDHDPRFGSAARDAALRERPPDVRFRYQLAPVVMRDCGGELMPVYSIRPTALASRRPAELVLIDGPPEPMGGRRGTLYQLMDFLRPGALAFLDDAGRPSEREAMAHWRDHLGDAIEIALVPGHAKGLAAILVRTPVPRARRWDHRVALTARDLDAILPAGVEVVVADEGQCGPGLLPGREQHAFVERDGVSYGPPENDGEAIRCLDAWRARGIRHLVFVWPAFWWFEHYPRLMLHVRACGKIILENRRLLVFELT